MSSRKVSVVCHVCNKSRWVCRQQRAYIKERAIPCRKCGQRLKGERMRAANPKPTVCVHCKAKPVKRYRGLCWTCYADMDIRLSYPTERGAGRRGVEDSYGKSKCPAAPTTAPAGSLEKMREMARRAERGESLFHPRDCRASRAEHPFEGLPNWGAGMPTGLEPIATEQVA